MPLACASQPVCRLPEQGTRACQGKGKAAASAQNDVRAKVAGETWISGDGVRPVEPHGLRQPTATECFAAAHRTHRAHQR
jgi:hypothetical protein